MPTLPTRALGQGLKVSAIGLGCMSLTPGETNGAPDHWDPAGRQPRLDTALSTLPHFTLCPALRLLPLAGLYEGDVTEEQAAAVVRRAVELGITLFNTSDLYGPYKNEEMLGE